MSAVLELLLKLTDNASSGLDAVTGKIREAGSTAAGVASAGFAGLQTAVGVGLVSAGALRAA
ncbi:MAG: hypothetical protein IAE79_02905, partial [Anaerolinea sp.]|nr:hypothetical protein [Anaerolinea sp.]